MPIIIKTILAMLTIGIALCTVVHFYRFLYRTTEFNPTRREFNRGPLYVRARYYIVTISAGLGFGFMLYQGALGALWWMPANWTLVLDDEPELAMRVIALLIAVHGAIFVLSRLENLAEEFRGEN